jgi:hypothetical protein
MLSVEVVEAISQNIPGGTEKKHKTCPSGGASALRMPGAVPPSQTRLHGILVIMVPRSVWLVS